MKHYHPLKINLCFTLVILCATNSSFAINSNVLYPSLIQHKDSLEEDIAQQPGLLIQHVLKTQLIEEAKAKKRSERYFNKLARKSYKIHRPGNGKQTGWLILSIIVGAGLLMGAVLCVFVYGFVRSEGGSDAGWALGGASVFAILFAFIFADLLRWDKKYPGNSVKS